MDRITIDDYTFYGKVSGFNFNSNLETLENPGGNFLLLYNGLFTVPVEVEFELLDCKMGNSLIPLSMFVNKQESDQLPYYTAYLYLSNCNYNFMVYIYNIVIEERFLVYVHSPDYDYIRGYNYLNKGKLTVCSRRA